MNGTVIAQVLSRLALGVVVLGAAGPARAQAGRFAAEAADIVKADTAFARSVAERNRAQFATFLADVTTFGGGTANELRGREAVMQEWSDYFDPDGPTLAWTPTHAEVVGAGDLGVSTGTATVRGKAADGRVVERHSEYLTVWRKQKDGSWKVIFDTGSTLPAAAR